MTRPMQSALPWRLLPVATRLAVVKDARIYGFTLVALTALGFALRLGLLSVFPLREDEAIYGYWARVATSDPFFLQVWPDKPPLFIWLLTGAFALLGPSEATARLVSIFASTLTIPLVALGAQQLWRSRMAALMAALLLALNPYAISFAPTAYTDSLLVLFGVGATVLALKGRALGAGLLLGAACMTKQQGLFYAPLVVALLLTEFVGAGPRARPPLRDNPPERDGTGAIPYVKKLAWFLLGVALIVLPILWWDSQRWAVAPSSWELAQRTYAPLSWLPPQEWLARWDAWAQLLWYLGGSWTVWLIFALAIGAAVTATFCGGCHLAWMGVPQVTVTSESDSHPEYRPRLILLLGWGIGFVLLHLITSVQVWDRYLLPLAPWLALVVSGPLVMVLQWRLPEWQRGILLLVLVVSLVESVPPAMAAARGELPIGGDHGDYAGLTEAIVWVEGQCDLPHPPQTGRESALRGQRSTLSTLRWSEDFGDKYTVPSPNWGGLGWGSACPAILYHQVLGWHFRFYLYDQLQPTGDTPPRFDLRWFPSAAYLADNAVKSPYPPKYLIVPDWATPRDLALHLAMRGLALEPRLHVGRFAVMEIIQPPRPLCNWCKSAAPFTLDQPTLPAKPQMSTP